MSILKLNSLLNSGEQVLRFVGNKTIKGFAAVGRFSIFVGKSCQCCFSLPFYPQMLGKQLIEIGYFSLPVVALTAVFTGGVLALQTFAGVSRFSAESTVPSVVAIALTRELGPVLSGLMVAGRIGAAIAAEIGTMKVTEQLDALNTLSVNPIRYLVVPRIIAGLISLPILVLIADIIGLAGGLAASVVSLKFVPAVYLSNTFQFLQLNDVISGITKAAAFGFIITVVGSYFGYHSGKGAQGVGKATTDAVVVSSILILLVNYLMTEAFFV